MSKRLRTFFLSGLRWLMRQVMLSVVLLVGVVIGWGVRKATGPVVVSERVGGGPEQPIRMGLAPVGGVDPTARGWLEEAAAMGAPGETLAGFKRLLEAGAMGDLGRVARAMLSHPLPLFREEALAALLPVWSRSDPGEALRFFVEYEADLRSSMGERQRLGSLAREIGREAGRRDPEAALRLLPAPSKERERTWVLGIWQGLGAMGEKGDPGLAERLQQVTEVRGESGVVDFFKHANLSPWMNSGRQPSADEWRRLAAGAELFEVRSRYQELAVLQWAGMDGRQPTLAEAEAWVGGPLTPAAKATLMKVGAPGTAAALVGAEASGEGSSFVRTRAFTQLMAENPAAAREVFATTSAGNWLDASDFARAVRAGGDGELRPWLAVMPEAEQRQDLLRHWLLPFTHPHTVQHLEASTREALAFGQDGESAAVAMLTDRSAKLVQAVPEVFAAWPVDVQERTRLELVLGLGNRAPDVAAELWMDAGPDELAQPGVAVVAEELAARLLLRDPEVASAWILQLPEGESRDRAVARMIERTAHVDPTTCAEWAATIVDPAARGRATLALERVANLLIGP